MQFLSLRVGVRKLDDELATFIREAARCDDNNMAGAKEYRLVVAEGLEVVRGVYGRPGIGEDGAMIYLFDHLYLIAYLDRTNRAQRQTISKCAELAAIDRNVKALVSGQNVDHKELPADNRIGQIDIVIDMGLLLAPDAVHAGIAHDHIIAEIAGEPQPNVRIGIHRRLGRAEIDMESGI